MKFRKMKCMIVLSFCLVLSGCGNAEKRDTENIPDDVSGETVSVEYSDDFPVELQEMLVYQYSGIGDENSNGWEQYKADCEIITLESSGDIPFEDIVKAADINSNLDKISMQAADIDGDGIDEYVINDSIGRGQLGCIYVVKNVDEKWTLIGGGNARYSTDVCSLLKYKDRYYLLVGAELSCWNEEAEIPDRDYWEKWDSAPWQADVWDVLEIEETNNGYTLSNRKKEDNEQYIYYLEDEDVKDDSVLHAFVRNEITS